MDPEEDQGDVARTRERADETRVLKRHVADRARSDERVRLDETRRYGVGGRQIDENIRRERRQDDESLHRERVQSDESLRMERIQADDSLDLERTRRESDAANCGVQRAALLERLTETLGFISEAPGLSAEAGRAVELARSLLVRLIELDELHPTASRDGDAPGDVS